MDRSYGRSPEATRRVSPGRWHYPVLPAPSPLLNPQRVAHTHCCRIPRVNGDPIVPGKLILVRHGQSTWNVENLFTGWHDVDLSEQGRRGSRRGRAPAAGGKAQHRPRLHLGAEARHPHAVDHLDGMDRMWLPVERSWRLNERHYGALQGLNKAQTVEKHGEAQVKIWRRSYDIPAAAAGARRSAPSALRPALRGARLRSCCPPPSR